MADRKDYLSQYGITEVPLGDTEHVAWWSSIDARKGPARVSENMDEAALKILHENAQRAAATMSKGTEIPIWQKARGATNRGNYTQQVISQLDNINLNKDSFVFMDLEALGTLSPNAKRKERMGYVSPTEIALQHTKIRTNGTSKILSDVNMVLHPGVHSKSLNDLLTKLEANPFGFATSMSVDERRSLSDLILYSDKSNFGTTMINGKQISTIAKQSRGAMPIGIADLSNSSAVTKMRAGLNNLLTMGTDPVTAIEVMSDFFEGVTNQTKGQVRIAGQNIRLYDLPVLDQMIKENMVGAHANNPKLRRALDLVKGPNYIDTLQIERTLNSNIAVKYPNLKLSTLAEARGVLDYKGKYITPGVSQAHYAAYDVEMNGRVFASQLSQYKRLKGSGRTPQEIMNGHKYITPGGGAGPVSYTAKNLKVGDRLFALSGVTGFEAGKYDAVYGEDMSPISTMRGSNPLYRNSTYRVRNYGQADIEGKMMHTLTLYNEDRDTYHYFARDSVEEIQNIVHKNMEYVSGRPTKEQRELAKRAKQDAAIRRYNKMFSTESGGGINLYDRYSRALEAYESNKGLKKAELEKVVRDAAYYIDNKGQRVSASSSFFRDFYTSKGRFAQEKQYYDPFIEMISRDTQFKGNKNAINMALSAYHDKMNTAFGGNQIAQPILEQGRGLRSILPINIDGQSLNIQVSDDIDALQNSLNSTINHGHVAKNMTPHTIKGRLRQVVNQMRAQDQIRMSAARDIMKAIETLPNDSSASYIMRDIALAINEARRDATVQNKTFGLQSIDVENPTKLMPARKKALKSGFDSLYGNLAKSAVEDTLPYIHRATNGISVPADSQIARLFKTHDETVARLVENSGFGNVVKAPDPVKKTLNKLVQGYIDPTGKTGTSLFYGGKNEVTLAVYGIDMADQVRGMTYRQIMENNRIVTMSIPMMKENQSLRYGRQERLGRLSVGMNGEAMQFATGFDEVTQSFYNARNKVFEMIGQGRAIDATTMLRGIGRRTLENLSQNRSKSRRDSYDDPFRMTESRASNWARGGTADFSNLAEQWWKEQYGATHPDVYNNIKNKMKKNPGMSFVEAMGGTKIDQGGKRIDASLRWALDMETWLAGKGINVNSHSIKNTLVNNDVRSFNDVGELTPFGNYNMAAREKHFKVLNYLPLNEQEVRENLLKSGYTNADADRMMRLGTTTDRAIEVMGDEVNYLSMRTAYSNTALVAEQFKNPHLSTSEGMFVLRKELAGAFQVREQKYANLTEGARLHEDFVKLLSAPGEQADLSKTILLDKPISIKEAIRDHRLTYDKNKGLTVGGLQREIIDKDGIAEFYETDQGRFLKTKFHATDFYDDQHINNTYIKGWDAERQALVMDVVRQVEDGDKFVGSGGLRGTVTLVEGKAIDKTVFKGMDAILPQINMGHRDFGAYMRSSADLAYDEMRRKVTAGKISLEDGLTTLRELMTKHFELSETDIRVEQDRIVLDKALGLTNKQTQNASRVYSFLAEAGNTFGADLLNETHGFMIGQSGLAVSATPKWENRRGARSLEQGGDVRWGLKELDMINDRLRALSNGESGSGVKIQTSAIQKWLTDSSVSGGVQEMMRAQNPDGPRMAKAYTRTLLNAYGQTEIRPGEVIIRTQATQGEFGGIGDGRGAAYVDGQGVVHVSGDNFSQLPSASKKGGIQTVGDLQNTILTMHQNELPLSDGKGSLRDAIAANHGTALVELPAGMDQSHVRFVSSDIQKVGASDMAVMSEIQRKEASIWRGIQEFSATSSDKTPDDIRSSLQKNINEYHDLVRRAQVSSRDGSVSKTTMSVMMDHSGRFKGQGINPVEALSRQYEEGAFYVSRNEMRTMIQGAETNIAELMGIDLSGIDMTKRKGRTTVSNLVLDKIQEEGLYGFVGRYPTINRDTLQIAKIQVDPKLGNKKGIYSTLATSIQLKEDYDGDFINTVLSHYGHTGDSDLLKDIHQEMRGAFEDNRDRITNLLNDPTSKFAKDIEKEVGNRNFTAGDLAQMELEFKPQRGGVYNLESTTARVNGSLIGRADNTRLKLWNVVDSTFDILEQNGRVSTAEASKTKDLIQEFGRVLSQDFISSKKFNVEEIAKDLGTTVEDPRVAEMISQRQGALASFMDGIHAPTHEGINQMREANAVLDLFKNPDEFGRMTSSLQTLYRMHGDGYLHNSSLGLAVSEGLAGEKLGDFYNGQGGPVHNTPYVRNYLKNIEEDLSPDIQKVKNNIQRGLELNQKQVLSQWDKMNNPQAMFQSDAYRLGEEMLGSSAAQKTGVGMRDFAGQVFGSLKQHGGSLTAVGIAAGVFGGIWATSSLMRKTPTPEGNEAQQEARTPVPQSMMAPPTARIMPNEDINIHISGKDANNMSAEEVSALVQSEMNAMVPMGVNMNLNLRDNTQNIDKSWLQNIMANALN